MTRTIKPTTQPNFLLGLFILLVGISTAALAGEIAAPWRQFDFAGKVVTVQPDLGENGERSYEVMVEENGLAAARLSVNRNGVLSEAWKTDLDGDGNPEIVVVVGQLGGGNMGSADIHEWDGYKFASVRARQRIESEQAAYDGHDQYKVVSGKLMRAFPRFRDDNGGKIPAGDKARFRYDMRTDQWVRL